MEQDSWLVDIGGKQYEADDITIRRWIKERRLTGEHRVKKGGLPWAEARLVPQLRTLFADQERTNLTTPGRARTLITTGPIPERYEILDTVFAFDSSPEKIFQSDHIDDAFSRVSEKLRRRCQSLGGDAVIYTQFEYRAAVDGIFGKTQVMEFFAYGTAVRILESEEL